MIKGLLIDLDGTIYNDNVPIPGAIETVNRLRERGIPFRFITNTTMKSRKTLKKKLAGMGIETSENEIFSAAYAGALYVGRKPGASCYLLLLKDAQKEYHRCRSGGDRVDYVVVGDLGEEADFESLNRAFLYLLDGAQLIALQKNRYWLSDKGYVMDAGAFVVMLEYAAAVESLVIGKPSPAFFEMAISDLGLRADEIVMIGDDIESDIGGAQNMGMHGILVRTGKFRPEDLEKSDIKPDGVIDSIDRILEMGTILE